MTAPTEDAESRFFRECLARPADQLIVPGHPAGDFLEAYGWKIVEESRGFLRVRAHLPPQVRNLRGQLFGGFTPVYVDLVALFTVSAGEPREVSAFPYWLTTASIRVDYFEPVAADFTIASRVVKQRGRVHLVETSFFEPEDTLAVFALTTATGTPPSVR